jgi:hypothetical protein
VTGYRLAAYYGLVKAMEDLAESGRDAYDVLKALGECAAALKPRPSRSDLKSVSRGWRRHVRREKAAERKAGRPRKTALIK